MSNAKVTYEFSGELGKRISKVFDDRLKTKRLVSFVSNWIDAHNEILLDKGMRVRPMFKPSDDEFLMEIAGLTRKDYEEHISRNSALNPKWKLANPVYISPLLILREVTRRKDKQLIDLFSTFLAIRLYSNLHNKYFTFEARSEVMDYTVNSLSNKFDLKKQGSLLAALRKQSSVNHIKYEKDLIKTDDENIASYIINLHTRLNSFVQYFFNEFKNVWESGQYMNTVNEDELGDASYGIERVSDSTEIVKASSAFSIWFISGNMNEDFIKFAANEANQPVNNIRNILDTIKRKDSDLVELMVNSLFALYVDHTSDSKFKGICSNKWIPFVLSRFNKTNTEDKSVLVLKRNMDVILNKYSQKFVSTHREATRSSYRKAILLYFALGIQAQRCR